MSDCDQDDESFSDIYQLDPLNTSSWHLCGLSTVSRYGVSVVVFTDYEAIFIAGGLRGTVYPAV